MTTIKDVYSLSELNVSHNPMMESLTTSIYNSIVDSFFINRWKFKNRWFHYFYSFLAIASFVIKTTLFVLEIISNLNSKSLDSSVISYVITEVWLLFIVLETLVYPSAQFIESFDTIWTQLPLSKEPDIIKELMKLLRFANIISITLFMTGTVISIVSGTFEYLSHLEAASKSYKYYFIGLKLIELYSNLIFVNIFRGFYICGAFIKIGHCYIHRRTIEIIKDAYASDLTIYRLRHQHYDLARCGELCDLTFRRFVTICCITTAPNTILILYNLAYTNLDLTSKICNILLIIQFSIFLLLFFPCLIGFYSYPGQSRDDLYLSTLVERSNTFKSEVLLFMDLLNQRSCGIKFMGIYLITPSIVPNLATLVFTYVMAAPNFFTSNKQA
ncbi:uncharacterized protein LOC107370147 isoform X1 [Tetranychus urticae]|uniref:Gustatory receptor n=1 Tax=Tetranychus urticae TaxID=32264 RepID=T1L408_TETUR|nr:uncharacterized protein LOC107370147 isoform X1 [Tetranychus urticae]